MTSVVGVNTPIVPATASLCKGCVSSTAGSNGARLWSPVPTAPQLPRMRCDPHFHLRRRLCDTKQPLRCKASRKDLQVLHQLTGLCPDAPVAHGKHYMHANMWLHEYIPSAFRYLAYVSHLPLCGPLRDHHGRPMSIHLPYGCMHLQNPYASMK